MPQNGQLAQAGTVRTLMVRAVKGDSSDISAVDSRVASNTTSIENGAAPSWPL